MKIGDKVKILSVNSLTSDYADEYLRTLVGREGIIEDYDDVNGGWNWGVHCGGPEEGIWFFKKNELELV